MLILKNVFFILAITYAWSILHKVQVILIKCLTLKVLILVLEFHNVTAAIHVVQYAEQEQEPLSMLANTALRKTYRKES